jgi:hypothetical protein
MIDNALILLREELAAYLTALGDPATVIIENIGLFETEQGAELKDNIIISSLISKKKAVLKTVRHLVNGPIIKRDTKTGPST